MITRERLMELLNYSPETGLFTWRIQRGKMRTGSRAGRVWDTGYNVVMLDGKNYLCGRLAWFYVHNEWPEQIDHKNRNRADDRIDNIRVATQSLNNANRTKDARCRYRGAYPRRKGWMSKIKCAGKVTYLGKFQSEEQAARAYDRAARQMFGQFAQLNFPDEGLTCGA